MTPEGLRRLLDGTTPGPWRVGLDRTEDETCAIHALVPRKGAVLAVLIADEIDNRDDADLIASAPDMAAMIAGMREEWGVSYRWANDDTARIEWGNDTREEAVKRARKMENYPGSRAYVFGVVRRYVTTPEEA